MPCDCSYMNPSNKEKEISKAACLLDELDGKTFSRSDWEGYHPQVYNKGAEGGHCDHLVTKLCSRLQKIDDISNYSLEMQIWWRDHQEEDKKRLERELANKKTEQDKAAALDKLSTYERDLLGI